ncbi:MAG: hypothetical protein IPK11_00910 [Ignavibacteria bacterium]|nr:hypothetical protein [Ignavibacteria bacterium]
MAGNPILFSDPLGDTPGTDNNNAPTDQLVPPEGGGGAGTNKDPIVNVGGSSNKNVSKTAVKLANTTQTPSIGIPEGIRLATRQDVSLVYRGKSILPLEMYDVVTNDGIVGKVGILPPSTYTKPTYIVHIESDKGANVLTQLTEALQNGGHDVVSSGEFAMAAGGGNGTNPLKSQFDSEIGNFVPRTRKTSPNAAKPKIVEVNEEFSTYIEVYHKGKLNNGEMHETRQLSTGIDKISVSKLDREGQVWTFRIPTIKFKKWEQEGLISYKIDCDQLTGVINNEIRFSPKITKELYEKYNVKE